MDLVLATEVALAVQTEEQMAEILLALAEAEVLVDQSQVVQTAEIQADQMTVEMAEDQIVEETQVATQAVILEETLEAMTAAWAISQEKQQVIDS